MSLLFGLLGHASAFEPAEAQQEHGRLLPGGEAVEAAFRLIRDVILFTDRRMILVDKQGMTSRKIEYISIPYRSIVRFSIESAGQFDLDDEPKIWISGTSAQFKEPSIASSTSISSRRSWAMRAVDRCRHSPTGSGSVRRTTSWGQTATVTS